MEKTERKSPRTRSPAYPVIDLKEAIQKAVILWEKDKANPIPRVVAYKHLGYGGGGYAGRIIAALRQFDLTSEKSGNIILTQNAVDLALYKPENHEYIDIIKKIALKPSIYRIIFNEYNGQLPSDDTLRIRLIKGYKFNVDKVTKFIKVFRSTISFAGLSGLEEEIEIDKHERGFEQDESRKQTLPPSGRVWGKASVKGEVSMLKEEGRSFPHPGGITITFEKLPVKKAALDKLKKWMDLYEDDLIGTEQFEEQQFGQED